MPVDFAKRLAAMLIESHEDRVTVDLVGDGFSEQVAGELEKLGFEVQRYPMRPHRLTIVRKPPEPTV